jgi:cytoskeletal protein CcmA (bactofilin family)
MLTEATFPTLIAEGTTLQGDLSFLSSAQIFGTIDGVIRQLSIETLQGGRTGWINGGILSKGPVFIEGRVEGKIVSEIKVVLYATATVKGSIKAPAIEVRSGASIDGELSMREKSSAKTLPSKQVPPGPIDPMSNQSSETPCVA